jgi:nitrogen regulatory protein PII
LFLAYVLLYILFHWKWSVGGGVMSEVIEAVASTGAGKRQGLPGSLKEVIAIVRPAKHVITRRALEAAGIFSYTTFPVLGRSRQRGLRFQSKDKEEVAIRFLPKQYFSIVIPKVQLSAAVAVIMKVNRTGEGQFGDGRIFVVDIDEAIRVSSGETGTEALL